MSDEPSRKSWLIPSKGSVIALLLMVGSCGWCMWSAAGPARQADRAASRVKLGMSFSEAIQAADPAESTFMISTRIDPPGEKELSEIRFIEGEAYLSSSERRVSVAEALKALDQEIAAVKSDSVVRVGLTWSLGHDTYKTVGFELVEGKVEKID